MLYTTMLRQIAKYALGLLVLSSLLVPGVGVSKLTGSLSEEAIAERLKPLSQVKLDGSSADTAKPQAAAGGPEAIYKKNCALCHKGGLAGAPKFGDKKDWASRVAQGKDKLYQNAINGIRAMPPMGNCMNCSKDDIRETIDWMIEKVS